MRWGLIARPETDRGLGIQSHAIADNLNPDFTLIVDVDSGYSKDFTFPGHTWRIKPTLENHLDMVIVEGQLRNAKLDVLVTVEAWYDDRMLALCESLGIRTANQMNPEFYRSHKAHHPDDWWWPTSWLTQRLPQGVPMPVPVPWLGVENERQPGPLRVLHVVGKPAYGDRNGTRLLLEALPLVQSEITLTLYCQERFDKIEPLIDEALRQADRNGNRDLAVHVTMASISDRMAMYRDQDLLVLPRRYGGLSLTVLEALGLGLAVAMPDCPPNNGWPISALEWEYGQHVSLPVGNTRTATTSPQSIARRIDEFANDAVLLRKTKAASTSWAWHNDWKSLAPRYLERLEQLAAR